MTTMTNLLTRHMLLWGKGMTGMMMSLKMAFLDMVTYFVMLKLTKRRKVVVPRNAQLLRSLVPANDPLRMMMMLFRFGVGPNHIS